jgi:hypothetical protein
LISAAYLTDDSETVNYVIEHIKDRIRDTIESDGHIPLETNRGASGIWYTYYNLAPLTAACQVAVNATDVDLFNYTSPNDRSIRIALDCLFYYSEHPDEWPYYEGEPSLPDPHAWPGNLFMAMASIYDYGPYEDWVRSSGPVDDTTWWGSVHFGWFFPVLMQPSIGATSDWRFDGWTGDVADPDSASTTVTMDSDKMVTANFALVGDANEDGVIDGRDVIRCKRIILGLEPETCGADANADGVVDGRDVIRIKKMVLGIE